MNRGQIRTQALEMLDDTNETKITAAMVNRWIDLGHDDLLSDLELDRMSQTIITVANEPNYQLDSNALRIFEVYLSDENNDQNRIDVITEDEIASRYGGGWRSDDAGKPVVAALGDYNVLRLYPTPNATHAGRTVRILSGRLTDSLSADSSEPRIMQALHDAITYFCVARGWAVLGNLKNHEYFLDLYDKKRIRFRHKAVGFSKDLDGFRF